jgi:hypothetical protein
MQVAFDDINSFQSFNWRNAKTLRCVSSTPVCVDAVAFGVKNNAVHLDRARANPLMSVATLAVRVPANSFVSMWVRTTDANTPLLQSMGTPDSLRMTLVAGQLQCSMSHYDTMVNARGGSTIADGLWHQVGCLVTPVSTNGAVTSFVDGVPIASAWQVLQSFLPAKVQIGELDGNYATMDLDELLIAAGNVSRDEIERLYNSQAPVDRVRINTQTLTPSMTMTPSKTPTSTRTITSSSTATLTVTPTPTPTLTPIYNGIGVQNGDFEAKGLGWNQRSTMNDTLIANWPAMPIWTGMYLAWLGGIADSRDVLDQTIRVPTDKTTLSVHMGFHSKDTVCTNDSAYLFVNDTRLTQLAVCNQSKWAPLSLYSQYEFDMHQWSNQSVLLTFFLNNDGANPSSWFIDTVKFIPTSNNSTLQNADFANTNGIAWVEESLDRGQQVGQFIADGVAKLGNMNPARNRAVDRISQYVTLSADVKRLLFNYAPRSDELCGKSYDVLNVEVADSIVDTIDICKMSAPQQKSIDISAFAGKRVRVSFFLVTDYFISSEVTIDNVVISN